MAKFKVGDRVRVIDDEPYLAHSVYYGMCGTIRKMGQYLGVEFNEAINGHSINGVLTGKACNKGLWFEATRLELIETEEKQMATPVLKNMKIRIKDEAHSRLVQEALFEMGCSWEYFGKDVSHTDGEVLWVDSDIISYSGMDSFNKYPNEEVELVTTYSFKPVDQEAKRKREEKEALQKNVAETQKQLDEMKHKLESM